MGNIHLREHKDGLVSIQINGKYLRLAYNNRRKYELSSSTPFYYKDMSTALVALQEYI